MNIKILDSWLREYLETQANPEKIGEVLSLTSVGVEHIEKYGTHDYVYDIEITTNRPDLMSIIGIAREAAVVLPQFGIEAKFLYKGPPQPKVTENSAEITIKNNPTLVNRINAVIMEVSMKKSPTSIINRLESSDIRSLNVLIDITNYVMRETGHPCHVFDYDRLTTKKLIIREADKGEKIVTLDEKAHTLPGGDIVADNGEGEIVDLLGVMGTANSVVTEETKRILFFLDNNDPVHIRRTSMNLGIRTEAAQLNEKGVDREAMYEAFLSGIELYQKYADGTIVSDLIDIYPNPLKPKTVSVSLDKINTVIGVTIDPQMAVTILNDLGFATSLNKNIITATVPSWRMGDVEISEDLIEEIARIYGYHNLPSILPPQTLNTYYHIGSDEFYWEKQIKNALLYWGFTECYTYSMISEQLYEEDPKDAVKIRNPLNEDHVYMRTTLMPSLLEVIYNHEIRPTIKLFEMAHTYHKKKGDLPDEVITLAGIMKVPHVNFYDGKGIVEQLLEVLGISNYRFVKSPQGGLSADLIVQKEHIGSVEQFDKELVQFELNVQKLLPYASRKKIYTPVAKYPPVIEDLRFQLQPSTQYAEVVEVILKSSELVHHVSLLDTYENKRTFRIIYQHDKRNLTNEEVRQEREKIIRNLSTKIHAKIV